MNKEEFDAAVEAARGRLRGTGAMPSKVKDPQAVGCLLYIVVLLLVAVLVGGCGDKIVCDCGWMTGPVHCDEGGTGMVWATIGPRLEGLVMVPDWGALNEWMVNIVGHPVDCPEGTFVVCGIVDGSMTTVLRPDLYIVVHADVLLCQPPVVPSQ